MRSQRRRVFISVCVSIAQPLLLSSSAFAATSGGGDISNVETFIRSLIKILASIAGLVATLFFVWGGYIYITSSGNPEHLERGKRTLMFSGVGLGIVIGAYALANIITDAATGAFGN